MATVFVFNMTMQLTGISTFVKKYLLASVSKPGCTIWQSLQKLLTTVAYNDYNERKTTAIIANLSCNLLQNNNTAYAMFVNVVDTAEIDVEEYYDCNIHGHVSMTNYHQHSRMLAVD